MILRMVVNDRFDQAVKNAIRENGPISVSSPSATSASKASGTARVASAKFTTAASVDSCANIPAWVANVAVRTLSYPDRGVIWVN